MVIFVLIVVVFLVIYFRVRPHDTTHQSSDHNAKKYGKGDPLVQQINANLKRNYTNATSAKRVTDHLRINTQKQSDLASQVRAAGGNVGYIAQNVATIYFCIAHFTKEGVSLTEAQRIYASLLIDATAYLQSGQIVLDEIQRSVCMAFAYSYGSSYFYTHRAYNFFDAPENAALICATADLEVLIFCANLGLDYHSVIDFVCENLYQIETMIQRTLDQGVNSPLLNDIMPLVLATFHNDAFVNLVQSFSTIE